MIDTPKKKQLVSLWVAGFTVLPSFVMAGVVLCILLSQARSVDSQYTEPGIADYQNGNYSKAIQELNTSIEMKRSNPYAYYYLGLSLKKTGDVLCARQSFLNAKSSEQSSKCPDADFIARCDRAINDIDECH